MILISHRGNTDGKFESWENEPTYIDKAISEGYDVEVDVWFVDNVLYLGHDKPDYGVDFRWIIDYQSCGYIVKIQKLLFTLKNVVMMLIIFGMKKIH